MLPTIFQCASILLSPSTGLMGNNMFAKKLEPGSSNNRDFPRVCGCCLGFVSYLPHLLFFCYMFSNVPRLSIFIVPRIAQNPQPFPKKMKIMWQSKKNHDFLNNSLSLSLYIYICIYIYIPMLSENVSDGCQPNVKNPVREMPKYMVLNYSKICLCLPFFILGWSFFSYFVLWMKDLALFDLKHG